MTARSRPPTDEQRTRVFDKHARGKPVTQRGVPSGPEVGTPTEIAPPPELARERSEPIRVISMKTPAELAAERQRAEVKQHHVKLRALSELAPSATPPMGYLAPPRDPRQVARRRVRDAIVWGSAVLAVAALVGVALWLLAT
ncbi:MAG TPA: hypothetical protein VFQ53_13800 [Kofleriaceae bacterium]|nr:hypothetical protein [Kofleriaceae bacterium]